MKPRDVIIGFIFLAILIGGIVWLYKYRKTKTVDLPLPTPTISERVNDAFPNLNIPEGTERINLDSINGSAGVGIATRTEILANLPDPKAGSSYKASLMNSEGKTILLGDLRVSKSGWIINYDSSKYPGYNKIVVSEGATPILEGSF